MKEEWDELKEILEDIVGPSIQTKVTLLIMKRIEELEKNLHYRIDTVHERINQHMGVP